MGVGGSGKQSLTRLAASVSGLEVFQIQLRKGYSVADLKVDLAQLYIKAGLKNIGTVFLLTDAQVPDEKFLVLINDMLASGEIPGLFADDDLEAVISGLRNEVKGAGIQDTRENIWKFFIDRVRRQLKVSDTPSPKHVKIYFLSLSHLSRSPSVLRLCCVSHLLVPHCVSGVASSLL